MLCICTTVVNKAEFVYCLYSFVYLFTHQRFLQVGFLQTQGCFLNPKKLFLQFFYYCKLTIVIFTIVLRIYYSESQKQNLCHKNKNMTKNYFEFRKFYIKNLKNHCFPSNPIILIFIIHAKWIILVHHVQPRIVEPTAQVQ